MTASRRPLTAADPATGVTIASSVYARGEHDDDERDDGDDDEGADSEADEGVDGDTPDSETNGDDTADEGMPGDRQAPLTAVRVAHFSPDAPAVDIYVDGDRIVSELEYETLTPYLELEPGTYTVTIRPAGDEETVAFERDLWLGRAFYTIAAIGSLEAGTLRTHVLIDDGSVLLRAVHAAPDAPAVDLYANDGDRPIVENLAFGDTTHYVSIPAASYTLDVRPTGDAATTVASFDVDLERAHAYTGFAVGYLEPGDDEDRAFTLRATIDGVTGTH
ncbi:DUF4397 domain-containing protein [Natronosalvus vescus]|uniref:DUF4397 domain-containing protein n=1 Tax=Natronosalvus vescus TaxID=2953881 RepID=UPI00209000C1|nr:DUF4397 domain-containing protein [Natronosalvus vescus]